MEFRQEIVSKFVKDVAEGRVCLNLDIKGRRPEDIQLISDITGKLISYLNDYVLGTKAGEEFDFLERQLFFCISVLRSYDAFKTSIIPSKMEEDIQRIESKIDSVSKLLNETLNAPKPPPKKAVKRKAKPSSSSH